MINAKSFVIWNETNKQVILTCTEPLWEFLQKIRTKKMDDFNIIELAKFWKELKTLEINLEGEKENAKEG